MIQCLLGSVKSRFVALIQLCCSLFVQNFTAGTSCPWSTHSSHILPIICLKLLCLSHVYSQLTLSFYCPLTAGTSCTLIRSCLMSAHSWYVLPPVCSQHVHLAHSSHFAHCSLTAGTLLSAHSWHVLQHMVNSIAGTSLQ